MCHVWKRHVETPVKRVDLIEDAPLVRGRGRPRKTKGQRLKAIKRGLDLDDLSVNIIHNRTLWFRLTPPSGKRFWWWLYCGVACCLKVCYLAIFGSEIRR